MTRRFPNIFAKVLIAACVSMLALLFLLPVLVVFTNSFMDYFEIITRYTHTLRPGNILHALEAPFHFIRMTLIPNSVTFGQYSELLLGTPQYLAQFWNSLALATPIVVGQVVISAAAAYAFEMSRFKYKESVYFVYIVVMLMPLQVALVPNFLVADLFGLLDTRWAIILPGIFNPFGVFLMRQFLRNLPRDYIEAAQIDGAGQVRTLLLVVMPMFKPALAALLILTFVENWNLVEAPRIFLTEVQEPLSVSLAAMSQTHPHLIFAASFFYLLPCVLIFIYGQKYMIEGIQLSGVK